MGPDPAREFTEATRAVLLWPRGAEESSAMLQAVLAGTADDVLVLVSAAAAPVLDDLSAAPRGRVTALAGEQGFAAALDEATRFFSWSELAVLTGAWILPDGWLEGLGRAANADDTVAGSVPLLGGGDSILFSGFDALQAVPLDTASVGEGHDRTGAPLPPRAVHPRVCPHLPSCAYLRRAPLELLGRPDHALAHPAAVLLDLAARALAVGLSWTLADDVYLQRRGDAPAPPTKAETEELARRYPWLSAACEDSVATEVGPLRRSLIAARAAVDRITVTIDARNLGSAFGGTQTYTVSLVRALARSGQVALRAVVDDQAAVATSRALFADCEIEIATYEQAVAGLPRTDLVHRPQQVFSPDDLLLLRLLGERLVISHLDLIAYRSPIYHESPDQWRHYRRTTRLALGVADRVVFLSEHARRDVLAEDLIEAGRTDVVPVGLDSATGGPVRRPDRLPSRRPFLLVLGADYAHKNRVFALELVAELRRAHGWDGILVLAGRHVPYGSSAAAEAAFLEGAPELVPHVVDLGAVDEPEKRWLLARAAALLCPSTYEGYGLTPLEAGAAGVPCVYAATTSLAEVVGAEAATILPWDPVASAAAALPLLGPGLARERHLELLSAAFGRCGSEPVADRLCQAYAEALRSPFRAAAPRSYEELERERIIAKLDVMYHDLSVRTAHGLPLIDRGGMLSESEQRGLMRIAQRRWLRTPVLGPIGFLGGLGREEEAD